MAKATRILILCFLSSLVVIEFFHPITSLSVDLGRHIKMGEVMWQTKHIVTTNLFSYTYPDFPFINHHWLSEVIFYLLQSFLGLNSLIVLTTLCYFSCFLLLYLFLKNKVSLFSLAISTLLSIGILALRTDVRPEMFSMLFTTIFVICLYQYRKLPSALIFILPFIEVAWVNLHIYFIVGPIIFGLFIFESILKRTMYPKKSLLLLWVAFFCTCGATLLNPHGATGALYPFQVFNNYGLSIAENLDIFSLDFPHSIFFFVSIISFFFILLFSIKRAMLIDWLLGIVFGILAITAIRNIALYAMIVIIPFARNLDPLAITIWKMIQPKLPYKNMTLYSFCLLLLLFTISLYIPFPAKTTGIGLGLDYGPQYAGDFYLANHLPANVYNNFDIGSYLDYILYPHQQTFVDGRPEAFPKSFFIDTYYNSEHDPRVFERITQHYNINTVVWDITDYTDESVTFLFHITRNPLWKFIYLDEHTAIFVKDTAQNQPVIKQYAMTEKTLHVSHLSNTSLGLIKLAAFFEEIEWNDQLIKVLKQMLSVDANNCSALRGIINAYISLHQEGFANIYTQRYDTICGQQN